MEQEISVTQAKPKPGKNNAGHFVQPAAQGGYAAAPRFGKPRDLRVFINNIPTGTEEANLRAFFDNFGLITNWYYEPPKTFGFATFSTEAEMNAALALNPVLFEGSFIQVQLATPKRGAAAPAPVQAYGAYAAPAPAPYAPYGFVAQPQQPQYQPAPAAYSPYGEQAAYGLQAPATYLPPPPVAGYDQQGGYLPPPPAASPYSPYGEQPVQYAAAAPRAAAAGGNAGNRRLFISNYPTGSTDDELRSHFGQFGAIDNSHITNPKPGSKFSSAFVSYIDRQMMLDALMSQGHFVGATQLNVVEAQPKPSSRFSPY